MSSERTAQMRYLRVTSLYTEVQRSSPGEGQNGCVVHICNFPRSQVVSCSFGSLLLINEHLGYSTWQGNRRSDGFEALCLEKH